MTDSYEHDIQQNMRAIQRRVQRAVQDEHPIQVVFVLTTTIAWALNNMESEDRKAVQIVLGPFLERIGKKVTNLTDDDIKH